MATKFEDSFTKILIDVLQEIFDYLEGDADKIYVYLACEGNDRGTGYFHEKDGRIIDSQECYDIAEKYNRLDELGECGEMVLKLLFKLEDLCKQYDKPMPTEIKLIYDVNSGTLDGNYQYEPMFSFDEDLIPYDMFERWEKEVKKAIG